MNQEFSFSDSGELIYRQISCFLTWFVGAAGFLYLQSGTVSPSVTATVGGDVLRHLSQAQILVYGLTLGSLGLIVFALSVVTIPTGAPTGIWWRGISTWPAFSILCLNSNPYLLKFHFCWSILAHLVSDK